MSETYYFQMSYLGTVLQAHYAWVTKASQHYNLGVNAFELQMFAFQHNSQDCHPSHKKLVQLCSY